MVNTDVVVVVVRTWHLMQLFGHFQQQGLLVTFGTAFGQPKVIVTCCCIVPSRTIVGVQYGCLVKGLGRFSGLVQGHVCHAKTKVAAGEIR